MKVVFLDRDGVINRYPGDRQYVTSRSQFRFLPGALKAIARLTAKKVRIFVISNQAGVGKGIYSQQRLDELTAHMLCKIIQSGGRIQKVYYCTHRPEEKCGCRKPMAGMIELARRQYRLGKAQSFFVGDTIRDVQTARAAGCTAILVFSGKEKPSNRRHWELMPDYTFRNLAKAADFILT